MNKPHKHAELIKAWADGAEIEELLHSGEWFKVYHPDWDNADRYRIKPYEPNFGFIKPESKTVKMWQWVIKWDDGSGYYLGKNFYTEESKPYNAICKAEWTEIEVEVDEDN